MRFNDAKASIESRVQKQLIGVRANVSMSDTRSIRVFVMGEAKRAGSYVVSGLGTITSALYAAGGVKTIGSLRHIQLRRAGNLVRDLDLYDLLLHGNTTDDAKLLPGDVIFVPPVGPTVSIYGEVQRPAIYELRGETSVSQLITLAGGLTPEADASKAMLTQIGEKKQRNVSQVDLTQSQGGLTPRNGDSLRVDRLRPTLDAAVTLRGHLYNTGPVAFRPGMRLTDLISSVDQLQPNADLHYLLIRREMPPERRTAVLSVDLAAALASPGSAADVELAPRDEIIVFDLESGRDRLVQPLLEELRLQSNLQKPTEVVRIDGRAKVPGEYPLEPGMTVSDLLRAGGGLEDAAYGGKAELSRYNIENGEARRTQLIDIDLAAVMRGDPSADIVLMPFDSLSIKEVQDWGGQEQITLVGEVRFPGKYSLKRGETLRSVLARAGGLNDHAFAEGSVFTRTDLRDREQKQLDVLAQRLQNDLATLALQGAAANQGNAAQALTVGQSLLSQLRGARAVGRLVIDLPKTMRAEPNSQEDLILRDGDMLVVPRRPQEVTVIGEVQSPTSHLYREELSRDDYISASGGSTRKADTGSIYVVRADGSVVAHGGNRWFRSGGHIAMKPGDTVVVPLDTERLPALPFWQAVTSILYNVAISAAAVNSF
jgi:protein involved in polysaccharide export with SLBB domain